MNMLTKERLKNYLKGKYDVTDKQITEDLDIDESEFNNMEIWIKELIKEKWIKKVPTLNGFEYDPESAQGKEFDIGMYSK